MDQTPNYDEEAVQPMRDELTNVGLAEMRSAGAEVWVTDCPLAALQFEQHTGHKPMHPMSFLAKAYRPPQGGGFPNGIAKREQAP